MEFDAQTFDRLAGVAVGAAVGDAFGMPLEFGPPRALDRLVKEMTIGRMPAGSFTDDTEMALALAESLLAQRPLNPADLAARFVDWYRTSPPDVGVHTAQVLGRIARGVPWESASNSVWQANPENAGNGSVMRCWPAALAFWQGSSTARGCQRAAIPADACSSGVCRGFSFCQRFDCPPGAGG